MAVVLGQPRTGTSWVMQILKSMGLVIVGAKYRVDIDKRFNPNGFWEDPEWLCADKDPSKLSNRFAVKMELRSAVEKEIDLSRSKVIVCDRDRKESADSQRKAFHSSSIERIMKHDARWYEKFYGIGVDHLRIDFDMTEREKIESIREFI